MQYPFVSLKSSTCCLRRILRLPVTSIRPSILALKTCFRRQFLRAMWPIQLAFLLLSYVGYSSPPSLYVLHLYFSHDRSNSSPSFPEPHFISFQVFLIYFPKCSSFSTTQSYALSAALSFCLKFKSHLLVKSSSSFRILLLPRQSWIEFHVYILHHLLSRYPHTVIPRLTSDPANKFFG